jgi:hypothetical protein
MAEKIVTIITRTDDLDPTRDATKKRRFSVGGRDFEIDLCDENAQRFDHEMDGWVGAARRIRPGEQGQRTGASTRGTLPTITPVPARDTEWWHDPTPPLSTVTRQGFNEARRRVRHFGQEHGWPLGARGTIPSDVYLKWFDEVWSAMPEPSWDALARLDADDSRAPARKRRTAKPATRKP